MPRYLIYNNIIDLFLFLMCLNMKHFERLACLRFANCQV